MATSIIYRLSVVLFLFWSHCAICQDTTVMRTQEIEGVSVSFEKEEMIFEDSKSFIVDFYIGEGKKVLLLKQFKKYQLVLLNERLDVLNKISLDVKPNRIYEDCLGKLYAVTKDYMCEIVVHNNEVTLSKESILLDDMSFFEKCVGSNSHHYLLKSFSSHGKEVTYTSLKKESDNESIVYKVGDSLQIADVNLEAENIKREGYSSKDRMGEISISDLLEMRDKAERVFYFETVLEGNEYHPLFMQNDTTYIFDHLNDWVVRIDSVGNLIDSVPIVHHLNEEWGKELLQDKGRDDFYAANVDGAKRKYVLLNAHTFLPEREVDLEKNQVLKKVMVYNGYAYYAVRPNFQSNLNKLYRQRL